jgi:hypothetical protein
MSWLGQIRPHRRDESWSVSLWQTFFSTSMGAQIPVVVEMPLVVCGCRKFGIDSLGDHPCTCTTHSVVSTLSSVSHEASPYFLVNWDQDPHGLLMQTIIGRSQNFGGPSGPSGQNSIFPMCDGGRDEESAHCAVTSISLRTRVSLKKSNVKPFLMSLSISITSLSHSHADITRLSAALAAYCSVC